MNDRTVLVHLATGIGNIVLATPLLVVLARHFTRVDLLLHADYPGVAPLLQNWSALRAIYDGRAQALPGADYDIIVPAVPPYAWTRFERSYRGRRNVLKRPPDALFYIDEQGYYLDFADRLGCEASPAPYPFLPVSEPREDLDIDVSTVVIAPGCKTGEMATKRWPYFPELAEMFEDVVLVGTHDDLRYADGSTMVFPGHVRSMVDRLSLEDLAGVLAGCGTVVANDSGLGHMASAVGVPTVLIFGPTPDATLGRFPPNVTVLRSALPCQPCWFTRRFAACKGAISCLRELSLDTVAACITRNLAEVPVG